MVYNIRYEDESFAVWLEAEGQEVSLIETARKIDQVILRIGDREIEGISFFKR
jgi:hypothetical protein